MIIIINKQYSVCFSMAVNVVNPDLVRERENATFDCEQMTHVLDGGVEVTETRRRIGQPLYYDKQLFSQHTRG